MAMRLGERDYETDRQHIEERRAGHETNVHGNEAIVQGEPQGMNPHPFGMDFHMRLSQNECVRDGSEWASEYS